MRSKPLVLMDLSEANICGGPYVSTTRVMNSSLREKYDFQTLEYKTQLGRNISLKRIFDLRDQLKKYKPDIVHFSGLQLSGFHIAVACKLAGIKNTVVTVRGFSGDALNCSLFKRQLLTYILEPMTLLLSKKIYGVSNYVVSRRMIQLFKHKCCGAIYNFPPEPYRPDGQDGIRKELGFATSDIIAVSVARIIKDKGYHILADSMAACKNLDGLKFLIVGEGDYLATMQDKLSEQVKNGQVHFLGYRNDIQRILHECEIFILPTLHETLSVALLEASVEGLALIASNTGGVPEIVENDVNGILVEPGNAAELSNAIINVYNEKALRDRYGNNALMRVMQNFNKQNIEKRIDDVYSSLLEKGLLAK